MNKIVLINWRSHKKSIIKLAKTITSFTGKSDHGKSNILRAVIWNRFNTPSGLKFMRHGTSETKVIVDEVTHRRTKTVNSYLIKGHKEPYTSLKTGVPQQVVDSLNISNINIQEQIGDIFLLRDSPGKVADALSKLIDVKDAKETLGHVRSEHSNLNTKSKVSEEKLKEAKGRKKELEVFKTIDTQLRLLEQKRAKIDELQKTHATLYNEVENAKKWSSRLSEMPDISILPYLKKVVAEFHSIQQEKKKADMLKTMITNAQNNQWAYGVDIDYFIKEAKSLLYNECTKAQNLQNAIIKCQKCISMYESTMATQRVMESKKEKIIGDICPLCGKKQ